jgi:hypothetical protein
MPHVFKIKPALLISAILWLCMLAGPNLAEEADTTVPAPCETQSTIPDSVATMQSACSVTACYGNPRDALHAFTECLKNGDGQLLYNLFPACVREKFDEYYETNRSRVSPLITNTVEFITWLLAKARSEIPSSGYAYGFSALILVVTNEPFDQLGGSLRRKGSNATFTIGGGEELIFSHEDSGWTLQYDYANELFDELKDVSHLPRNTTASEEDGNKS